jgi:hypothetical protein
MKCWFGPTGAGTSFLEAVFTWNFAIERKD